MTDLAKKSDSGNAHSEVRVLIDRVIEGCRQLSELSDWQVDAIAANEMERFLELIDQRGPVVQDLAVAGESLDRLLDQVADESLRLDALRQLELARATIEKIQARDREHRGILRSVRDEMADQLTSMQVNQRAVGAYSMRPKDPNPTIQDATG